MLLNVLYCIHSLSSGAETQLVNFANYSREADIESAIFCVDPGSNLKNDLCTFYSIFDQSNFPITAKSFKGIKDVLEFAGCLLLADAVVANKMPAQSNILF